MTERWRREWNIRFRCRMYFGFRQSEMLELVLKKNETNAELYDRLGENNHVIGTVTFTFRQAVPATASDSTASRGSFASVRFNRPLLKRFSGLTGEYSRRRHLRRRWPVSQLSDDEPDEDIIEVSNIWFSFRVSGSVEWSDICSRMCMRRFFHLRASVTFPFSFRSLF